MSDNPYSAPQTDIGSMSALEGDQPVVLASRFKRLVARFVDSILLSLVLLILEFLLPDGLISSAIFDEEALNRILAESEGSNPFWIFYQVFFSLQFTYYGLVSWLLSILLYFLIQGYLLATLGQTCGKWLLRIKIVDYDTNTLPKLRTTFGLRECGIFILDWLLIAHLIDVLFIFGSSRRCLHDYWSRTKVVQVS